MQTNNEVGQTIAKQIGHSAFTMLGAKDILSIEQGLQFKIRGSAKVNTIRIVLDASDTYTVTFLKIRGTTIKAIREFDNTYCDQLEELFNEVTGLVTRM